MGRSRSRCANSSPPKSPVSSRSWTPTALVCCTTISYTTGHRHDVAEIGRLSHAAGPLCLADSYQAIGAIDFDARALGVDFVTGVTREVPTRLVGARPSLRASRAARRLPGQTGWFGRGHLPDGHLRLLARRRCATLRRRHSARSEHLCRAGRNVTDRGIGTAAIEEHVARLSARLIDGLDELGATVATPRNPAARSCACGQPM